MSIAQPQAEHQWLQQLIGDWTSEMECSMGPDQPPMKMQGSESVRSLGGLWTIGEGLGDNPEGEPCGSVMTLGYDPAQNRFVGTFVASVMTHMWLYAGTLDAAGKVLTLDTEGPSFTDPTKTAKYQDIIEIVSPSERTLSSRFLGDDGTWHSFMRVVYRRK